MTHLRTASMALLLLMPTTGSADELFRTTIQPLLRQHCFSCHGPEKQTSQIRYDKLEGYRTGERHLWTMVHEKVGAGEMPPPERPQPTVEQRKLLLGWIEQNQRDTAGGSTRRLNRREVAAALRDLTGLNVDYAQGLPGDGTVAGFDTGAEGLQDAADGIAQWMRVSRRAVDGIRFLAPSTGKNYAANLRESKDAKKLLDEWKADNLTVKGPMVPRPGVGVLIEPRAAGERDTLNFTVPVPAGGQGVLRFKVVVSAMKLLPNLPNPRLWVEIGGRDIDFAEITGTFDKPQEFVYQVQLEDLAIQPKGVTISLSNKVEIPYAVEGFENEEKSKPDEVIPGGTGLFRPTFDRRALPPEKQPVPYLVLQRIEIEPSHVAAWPPVDWKADVGALEDRPEVAAKLLGLWTARAWRRPVSEAELAPFLNLYTQLRKQNLSFDDALRAAFQSVLMSGPFRYLAPTKPADDVLARYALASRLSFFLTGSPPDETLRRLVAEGKLREPAVLDAQVDRLLSDPRSQGFYRPFVMQWLDLEQPITIASAYIQKQDFRFARYLKASLREETIAYIGQMVGENRPAKELIVSDWTLMNDSTAIHYGYPALEGGQFRKVKLRASDPRGGGILGHAGIQSMLCWMGENWVIYRGAWALRHVLDHPPPPPPLEVPELNPSEGGNKGKPFRELLKQHQTDVRCNVCHKNIDPVGFAFQNFDISGRWRDVEYEHYIRSELDGKIAWRGAGTTRPVDATGKMPRGEEFKNFAEFKAVIVKDYQKDLVRGLMKNLLVYATGRKPDVADLKEVAAIMKNCESEGYRLRDLVKAIVRSRAFGEN